MAASAGDLTHIRVPAKARLGRYRGLGYRVNAVRPGCQRVCPIIERARSRIVAGEAELAGGVVTHQKFGHRRVPELVMYVVAGVAFDVGVDQLHGGVPGLVRTY